MNPNIAITLAFVIGLILGAFSVYIFYSSRQKETIVKSSGIDSEKLLQLLLQNQSSFNSGKLSGVQFEQENERLLKMKKDPDKVITASFEDLSSNITKTQKVAEPNKRRSVKSDLSALKKLNKQ